MTRKEQNKDSPFTGLSTRTQNVLRLLGVADREQLKQVTIADILYCRNAGPATAKELVDFVWRRI